MAAHQKSGAGVTGTETSQPRPGERRTRGATAPGKKGAHVRATCTARAWPATVAGNESAITQPERERDERRTA
jgi:hypothetical protein